MSLLSSPSRSHPTHRKGRCSHDIIPHASAIASLLIVYASIRFPGMADVVPVTGTCAILQSSLAGQAHGRNGYKPPETTISINPNKFAFRLSAVHPAAISHTTSSTCKPRSRQSISPMDSFSNILAMLSASKVNDESNPTSSIPVDEESSSSSGGCYCVIA